MRLATLFIVGLLSACGGGGSSEPQSSPNPNPTSPVTDLNSPPDILVLSYQISEDGVLNEQISAQDNEGDALSFAVTSPTSNGALNFNNDGSFTYTPNPNYFGEDSFTLNVSDGTATTTETITLDITSVNDAPTISDNDYFTRLNNPITFSLNGGDVDNDSLTFQIINQPTQGSLVINEDNSATYTPENDAQGIDTLTISVSDNEYSDTAEITIDNNLSFTGQLALNGASIDDLQVVVSSENSLTNIHVEDDGSFRVYGLEDGSYNVKARKPGFKSSATQDINLDLLSSTTPKSHRKTDGSAETIPTVSFELEQLDADKFVYHWEEDQSTSGYDYAAYVNQPPQIEFLGDQLTLIPEASAQELQHNYNILLVNEQGYEQWSQEYAYRILETMKSIPQVTRDFYQEQSLNPSKWMLSSDFISDDILITESDGNKTITISTAAFIHASPKIAKVEGKRGIYYSQRLHHALIRYVTDNGTNQDAYEKILTERFGVTTVVDNYATLTSGITNETAGSFQSFHAEEIVQIINMFEEMPKGMHKISNLDYLVRRLDGTPHPLYQSAPAVAWTLENNGYIEFMETAFNTHSIEYMHRLIIHEKAHFLWDRVFDQQLKDDWIAIGGWFEDANDPDGWSTTNQTQFVSAYAHQKNPNEDMAESISYYIVNPDLLKSRSIDKYNFVRDRIMRGTVYISQIQENLTFQVYNLYPDYVFPGKIKRVDLSVDGAADADKTITVEIELHALDLLAEGAKNAYLRVFSEIGTYVDLYLYPIDESGNAIALGTVLRGSFTLNKYAKNGYWRTEQIVITDQVGNQRMEGSNDFGWALHVNNALEDVTPPEYLTNSAQLSVSSEQQDGQNIQVIKATWDVNENREMNANSPCYASLNDDLENTYRFEAYGLFEASTSHCEVDFIMPDYMPTSNYTMNFISMTDAALNKRGTYFTAPDHGMRDEDVAISESPQSIGLVTANPDTEQPELDLNDITISAVPTNPENPNGETVVTLSFKVRDNISGYKIASINLRDPQGVNHQYWVYNEGTWSIYPDEDPTIWRTYTRTVILPVGSAPGTWGLSEMTIYDRANNFKSYDFTETIIFDLEG